MSDNFLFETGDIVAGEGNTVLHSGSGIYPCAVVVSVRPPVLVSLEADMLWRATVADMNLRRVSIADSATLRRCMDRFLSDYAEQQRG